MQHVAHGKDVEKLGYDIESRVPGTGKRTDRIGGEVGAMGFFIPGWGMHLADMAAAQGDLGCVEGRKIMLAFSPSTQ